MMENHDENNDNLVGSHTKEVNNNNNCDRRLSRAARSLLLRPLQSISKSVADDDDDESHTASTASSIWQLLDRTLTTRDVQKCPLVPSHDIFRREEASTIVHRPPPKSLNTRLGFSQRSGLSQLPKSKFASVQVYECGLCGKLFSSRYYLDLHMQRHHRENSTDNHSNAKICPATSWCPALPFCSQQALQLEPYYGPGSNGLDWHDRHTTHRRLWHQAHDEPCDATRMEQAQQRCLKLIENCFGPTASTMNDNHKQQQQLQIQRHLEKSVCHKISCPDRLHQLLLAASDATSEMTMLLNKQVHDWKDDWDDYYQEHHALGNFGMGLLLALCLWYIRQFWKSHRKLHHGRSNTRGQRLLQKRSSSSFLERTQQRLRNTKSKQQ